MPSGNHTPVLGRNPPPAYKPGRLVCDRLRNGYWAVRVQTPMGLSPADDLEYKTYTDALRALREMEHEGAKE